MVRHAKNDLTTWTQQEAVNFLRPYYQQATTSPLGCQICHLKPNNYGYSQVTSSSENLYNFLMHRLAIFAATGIVPDTTRHASHLCDTPRCFNSNHLVLETAIQNNARKNCLGDIICGWCDTAQRQCPHEPKCIRPTGQPGPAQCCLQSVPLETLRAILEARTQNEEDVVFSEPSPDPSPFQLSAEAPPFTPSQ